MTNFLTSCILIIDDVLLLIIYFLLDYFFYKNIKTENSKTNTGLRYFNITLFLMTIFALNCNIL